MDYTTEQFEVKNLLSIYILTSETSNVKAYEIADKLQPIIIIMQNGHLSCVHTSEQIHAKGIKARGDS